MVQSDPVPAGRSINPTSGKRRPLSLAYRILCVALILCFAVIGLIGIVLPIIPGIVFLLAAAYLITRVSRRGAVYLDRQPWYRRHSRPLEAAGELDMADKIGLFALMMARGAVAGVAGLFKLIRKLRV